MVRLLSAIVVVVGVAAGDAAAEESLPARAEVGKDLRLIAAGARGYYVPVRNNDVRILRFRLALGDIMAEVVRGTGGLAMDSAPGAQETFAALAEGDLDFAERYTRGARYSENFRGAGGFNGLLDARFAASGEFVNRFSDTKMSGSRFSNIFRIGLQGFFGKRFVHGSPTEFGGYSYTRRTSIAGGMLNFDYDLRVTNMLASRLGDDWSPYVGVSVGIANISVKASEPRRALIDDDVKVLAYQARAGVAYSLTPSLTAALGYRFFDADGADFRTVVGGAFEPEYRSHEMQVMVHYDF